MGGKGGFISIEQQRQRSIAGGNGFALKLKNDLIYREKFIKKQKEIIKKLYKEGKVKPPNWKGKTHTEYSKQKMKNTHKLNGSQKGNKNSQYETCWIFNNKLKINKKINKKDIEIWLNNDWCKGRKMVFKN